MIRRYFWLQKRLFDFFLFSYSYANLSLTTSFSHPTAFAIFSSLDPFHFFSCPPHFFLLSFSFLPLSLWDQVKSSFDTWATPDQLNYCQCTYRTNALSAHRWTFFSYWIKPFLINNVRGPNQLIVGRKLENLELEMRFTFSYLKS